MEENGDSVSTTSTKSDSPSHGPIQIVKIDDEAENHSFYLDEEALTEIMEDIRIRDKPLCIVSVAGKFIILIISYHYLLHLGKKFVVGLSKNCIIFKFQLFV